MCVCALNNIMTRVTRGISLEEWEEKAKLNEKQQQSVYDLQDACAELPLPSNWVGPFCCCPYTIIDVLLVFGR